MKKRWKLLGCLLITVSLMCGCGSAEKTTAKTDEITTESVPAISETETVTETIPAETETENDIISFSTSKDYLEYTKHEIIKDFDDKDALAIYFNYTNLSSESRTANSGIYTVVFQNGVQKNITFPDQPFDEYNNAMKQIQKDVTISICMMYELDDAESDVTIEFSDFADFTKDNKSFVLNLTQAPNEVETEPITETATEQITEDTSGRETETMSTIEAEAETSAIDEFSYSDYGVNIPIPDSWILASSNTSDEGNLKVQYYIPSSFASVFVNVVELSPEDEILRELLPPSALSSFKEEDTYQEIESNNVSVGGKSGKATAFFCNGNFYFLTTITTETCFVYLLYKHSEFDSENLDEYSDVLENMKFIDSTDTNTDSTKTNSAETSEDISLEFKNALAEAGNYLSHIPFSYSGLVSQLEFEGYSTEAATYAADNCNADWNEQAANKAKSYMEHMSFSRDELTSQLEYEGYTKEQAEYGAAAVGY